MGPTDPRTLEIFVFGEHRVKKTINTECPKALKGGDVGPLTLLGVYVWGPGRWGPPPEAKEPHRLAFFFVREKTKKKEKKHKPKRERGFPGRVMRVVRVV